MNNSNSSSNNNPEEQPLELKSHPNSTLTDETTQNIIEAELVTDTPSSTYSSVAITDKTSPPAETTKESHRQHVWVKESAASNEAKKMANTGSAVASFLLGLIAFSTSFVSGYALFPAGLGLLLFLVGLNSGKPRMAIFGGILCGLALTVVLLIALGKTAV